MKDYTHAAVLVPLFHANPESIIATNGGRYRIPRDAQLLLTVRTDTVEHHKGQISFPGGRKDPEDLNDLATALREAEEEIGLHRTSIRVLGQLPEVPIPRTKFLVRPFVGAIAQDCERTLVTAPAEIAKVLCVPIGHLLDPANSSLETHEHEGVQYKIKAYQFEGHRIWGATARMIQLLLELVE